MKYFDNLVISVAALVEPVVAEFLALLLGVGFLPGPVGWAGNLLVIVGTFCVIAPSAIASSSHSSSTPAATSSTTANGKTGDDSKKDAAH